MKQYVDVSIFNSRFNHITGALHYYLFEVKQWVEWGNIHEDDKGYYIQVWA